MRKTIVLFCASLVSSLAFTAATAYGDWVTWSPTQGGNGHSYLPVSVAAPISWNEAFTNARNQGGYLVTITSAEENAFVYSLINHPQYWNGEMGPPLGGYQPPGSPEPGGGWTWASGESWTYTHWEGNQPDNGAGGGVEDTMHFWSGSGWNDHMGTMPGFVGYVVERETPPPGSYDLSRDFSIAANPNGVWSYGWKSDLTGGFNLLPHARTGAFDNGVPVLTWELAQGVHPVVECNDTTNTGSSAGGQLVAPPGTVFCTAGFDGTAQNFGVIRFKVPDQGNGTYKLESAVSCLLDGAASKDADYHVVVNGVEAFSQFLAPDSATGYTNTFSLAAGDTVDFMCGRGADGLLSRFRPEDSSHVDSHRPGVPTSQGHRHGSGGKWLCRWGRYQRWRLRLHQCPARQNFWRWRQWCGCHGCCQ
jgi:hypothetical protein